MKRPATYHSDTWAGPEWYEYWDAITAAASHGHGMAVTWDGGIVYVDLAERPGASTLIAYPASPRWVASWSAESEQRAHVDGDGDRRLLPVADGPTIDADTAEVGEWIAVVIRTLAGHALTVDAPRDFRADGYTMPT